MFLHVKEAKHLHDYVIWLRFNDGAGAATMFSVWPGLRRKSTCRPMAAMPKPTKSDRCAWCS